MKNLILSASILCLLFSCKKNDRDNDNFNGFIYTSTKSFEGNSIIAMGKKNDGSVKELKGSPYATGSTGDAADGDFDTQGALRIVGDYLLAVNAGNNPVNGTVSVFKINKSDGSLSQVDQMPAAAGMDNMDSRGVRATSIAAKEIGGTTWVVVSNQHSNPHYEMDPPVAVGTVTSSSLRNIAVFTFNKSTGVLEFKNIGATYDEGNNGGPTTVDFNSSGTKIAVSTWGVTHIMAPEPAPELQTPSRLYIYDFSGGMLTQTGRHEEEGVSGSIGFSWSPSDKYIYLSNFNLTSSKEDNSVTVHDGNTGAKTQNFASGARNDEACWTWVSLDKSKLFVVSFAENIVSVFDIGSDDKLVKTLTPNFFLRSGKPPMGDSKDMYQSNGYLYVAGSFQTHTIASFKIAGSGALTEMGGSPYAVPSSIGKTKEQHAYLGLTGFDK